MYLEGNCAYPHLRLSTASVWASWSLSFHAGDFHSFSVSKLLVCQGVGSGFEPNFEDHGVTWMAAGFGKASIARSDINLRSLVTRLIGRARLEHDGQWHVGPLASHHSLWPAFTHDVDTRLTGFSFPLNNCAGSALCVWARSVATLHGVNSDGGDYHYLLSPTRAT
ncbi:hypothetical protein VNO77_08838 [Canavalia gladiata]|uniref:Uncharacterized protein n=1 Tax=Canavalia gladiata TaxID=3824 RepID=A0AAN9MCH9_CANGL